MTNKKIPLSWYFRPLTKAQNTKKEKIGSLSIVGVKEVKTENETK